MPGVSEFTVSAAKPHLGRLYACAADLQLKRNAASKTPGVPQQVQGLRRGEFKRPTKGPGGHVRRLQAVHVHVSRMHMP